MLVCSPEARVVCHWDGADLAIDPVNDGWHMLSSSSWNPDDVCRWREEAFDQWVDEGAMIHGELPAFHLRQREDHQAYGPLMSRDDAATRSITQIALDAPGGKTLMRYWAPPSSTPRPPDHVLRLDLTL